jgi:hypothetical protein
MPPTSPELVRTNLPRRRISRPCFPRRPSSCGPISLAAPLRQELYDPFIGRAYLDPLAAQRAVTVAALICGLRWPTRSSHSSFPHGHTQGERLPLDRLVIEATQAAALPMTYKGTSPDGVSVFSFLPLDQPFTGYRTVARAARSRPKPPADRLEADEKLKAVARVYREALQDGVAPTRQVAVEVCGDWDSGYHAAKRLVQQARKAGHLPPTVPGRKAA